VVDPESDRVGEALSIWSRLAMKKNIYQRIVSLYVINAKPLIAINHLIFKKN
jgi:hypothetical protein